MSTATLQAKKCVNCHKDVSTGKRMKDSSGRYWCLACGEADKRKKDQGVACSNCGERYPAAKLSKVGASRLCSGCNRQRTKGPGLLESIRSSMSGGGSGDAGEQRARLIKMLAVMGVLALVAVWRYYSLTHH
jgi:DNA-directed RNA polymerase subunit RPC12/RpoP